MKPLHAAALALFCALFVRGQAPVQIISTNKIGPEEVRVIFNVPVSPVGITNVLSDDFSSAEIDTGKWRINDSPFEVGGALGVRSVLQI